MTDPTANPGIAEDILRYQSRIEQVLDRCLQLPEPGTPRLLEAMRYSVLGGGKRLRPVLVYCTGEALGAPLASLDAAAAAVELIHAYSLIHDDLPAMDDDDLRRGQPTCHKAFDEGTAILAGDALQCLAFEVLAADRAGGMPPAAQLQALRVLAQGIGTAGMAGGQAIDLEAVGRRLDLTQLQDMHRRKTGALLKASVLLGAIGAGVTDGPEYAALDHFGAELGLAFQIQDDILDVEGDVTTLGKAVGADAALDKPTYPSLLGMARARALAQDARDKALDSLALFGARGAGLARLAHFVVDRRH